MTTFDEVNDFLLAGGVISAKFETPGTTVAGKITHLEKQQQREIASGTPKFWEDGKPREQIVAHLQTTSRDPELEDDDGVRAVYIRGNMLRAVREALKKARALLEVGGELTITYTGDGERAKAGFNPPKLYRAMYVPAAASAIGELLADTPAQPSATASVHATPDATAVLPPGISAEEWAVLPQAAKEGLAKLHGLPPF